MLQPINIQNNDVTIVPADPIRICEGCGKQVAGAQAINIMIVIGVAGDPRIAAFQCPFEEHWACCPECWSKVAHACIDEHMGTLLQYHNNQLDTVHARPDTSGDTDPALPVVKV